MSEIGETRVARSGIWERRGRQDIFPPDGFVLEQTEPTAANTGLAVLSSEPTLTEWNSGAMIINTPGQVVEGYRFLDGYIEVRAPDVVVQYNDCQGMVTAPGTRGLVTATHGSATNLTVQYNNFRPHTPQEAWADAIRGWSYTSRRNNISRVIDGLGVFNTLDPSATGALGVSEGDFIHDLAFFTSVQHSDGTHNDCIQCQSGRMHVLGSTLSAYLDPLVGDYDIRGSLTSKSPNGQALSALMYSAFSGATLGQSLIRGCWIYGGHQAVNAGGSTTQNKDIGYMWRNRFDGTHSGGTIDLDALTTCRAGDGYLVGSTQLTGSERDEDLENFNYYMSNGQPINVRRNQ